MRAGLPLFIVISLIPCALFGQWKQQPPTPLDTSKPPAFTEAAEVSKSFKLPRGLSVKAFAAEPQVVSPVALTVDEKGRVFVIETFRAWGNGGVDMRKYMEWLDDDLAAKSVEDRIKWVKERGGESAKILTLDEDRVRLLEDKDGDGQADSATVFADNYRALEDGIAAGILARKGDIYFGNIPSVYLLKDSDNDGKADQKTVLSTGYGVRYQLLGHDIHGFKFGPDGRVYFSVGDRGVNLTTKEGRQITNPESAAIFRMDPDGSNLEMIAHGLRNPQELAFDQYGNLFTADNNCDYGDSARWVWVTEGSDTGWRVGYQFITTPNGAGAWNSEKLWHMDGDHPAAYCVPAVGYAPPGPAGLAYYPGTGLGDGYKDRFFLCDFRGGTNSGIWTFAMKPKGAGFEVTERKQFMWNLLPTDLEFGPDGSLYVSDWVNGWFRPMKGRIWRVFDPAIANNDIVKETRKLIEEGMEKRDADALLKLLAHADQRVRTEAQYELVKRPDIAKALTKLAAADTEPQLARIHAIWALGQFARKDAKVLDPLIKLLDDGDSEIRAQAAKILGEAKHAAAYDALLKRLRDETLRVRYFATMGLAKIGKKEALPKIMDMIQDNADRDAYLRHAGHMAMLWMKDDAALMNAAKDASPSVRIIALLTMRRNLDARIAMFLDDAAPLLVEEAARATSDETIEGALPALAKLTTRKGLPRIVWMRAVNANVKLGAQDNLLALINLAKDDTAEENARVEALYAISNWKKPDNRDRLTGLWRPVKPRDPAVLASAKLDDIVKLATTGSPKIRTGAIWVIERLGVGGELLPHIVMDKNVTNDIRAEALRAMETLKHEKLHDAARIGFEQGAGTALRREAIGVFMRMPDAAGRVADLFKTASIADRKAILEALATAPAGTGDSILRGCMDMLLNGAMPAAVQLDLLEAAARSKDSVVAEKLKQWESQRGKSSLADQYIESLEGGDIARGRKVFFEKGSVACIRCHKVGGDQEVVGPNLAGVGVKRDRRYLLESIIMPNAHITEGFASVILKLKGNMTVGGILKGETESTITVADPNEGTESYEKSAIVSRTPGQSAMPDGFDKMMTKRELRDLVEFLSSLKDEKEKMEATPPAEGHGK